MTRGSYEEDTSHRGSRDRHAADLPGGRLRDRAVTPTEPPDAGSVAAWGTVPLGASPSAFAAAGESTKINVVPTDMAGILSLSSASAEVMTTDPEKPAYVEGQVVVRVSGQADITSLSKVTGVASIRRGRTQASTDIVVVVLVDGVSVSDALTSLADVTGVTHVQPNYIAYPTDSNGIPNDPLFPVLWGLHNTGEVIGTKDADIDAFEAWQTEPGSDRTIVAVIDTGIDPGHPDLIANLWTDRR